MSTKHPNEGLPEPLPRGERVLWRGRPDAFGLTLAAFRAGWVAAYFGVLLAWRFASQMADGAGVLAAAEYAVLILPVAGAALALLGLLGWLAARTTTYTVTDKRVVMRIGIALPLTLNVPFKAVEGASVKTRSGGRGDIAFQIETGGPRIGYLVLWPHARSWHFGRPEPALRAVPDVEALAGRIADALKGVHTTPMPETAHAGRQPAGLPAAAE